MGPPSKTFWIRLGYLFNIMYIFYCNTCLSIALSLPQTNLSNCSICPTYPMYAHVRYNPCTRNVYKLSLEYREETHKLSSQFTCFFLFFQKNYNRLNEEWFSWRTNMKLWPPETVPRWNWCYFRKLFIQKRAMEIWIVIWLQFTVDPMKE